MAACILIIDNDPDQARLMEALLRHGGHVVRRACDPEGALQMARELVPDLIVCDPGLAAPLRAALDLAGVSFLAAPGPGSASNALLAAGFDGYIAKPIEPDSFVAEVEAFLPPVPTLLVVDDDRFMLDLLADMLAQTGWRILLAGSGDEALARLADHDVQVLLCDQCMPGMSGAELAERVRRLYPHIWRIILSGQREEGAIGAALASGAADQYHAKPWNAAALSTTLRAALRQQRLRAGGVT